MTHCLEGKTITAINIAEDKEAIQFVLDGADPIIAKCDADCCSHTWVEAIELPALGFPAKVISASDLDLDKLDEERDEFDVIRFYGFKIVTDKGDIVIDYRNESNGYYGGNLSWPGDYFYGGVDGQQISSEKWVSVT